MPSWSTFHQPQTLDEALALKARYGHDARFVAGGTDLMVEYSRGVRSNPHVIDLTRVPGLQEISERDGMITLGALVTHNDVLRHPGCRSGILPLAEACWVIGAPQLRSRATIVGNIVTASPANDTITPLVALDAIVLIRSSRGSREVPISEFHLGVRKTVLEADEMVTGIRVPRLDTHSRGHYVTLGLRRAQSISVVHAASVVRFDGDRVAACRIALGSVGPTIIRAPRAEAFLIGKVLEEATWLEAGAIAAEESTPISDVRGSREYRLATTAALVAESLEHIGEDRGDLLPADPVLLETHSDAPSPTPFAGIIETTINGAPHRWTASSTTTLLRALRDEAHLSGTKEGCNEGECGSCTVWLGGKAVMSCVTPAAQAHGMSVTTIEGLAHDGRLNTMQEAFVSCGAVQCGFCIPGMVMAATKLAQERTTLTDEEMRIGLSGNLCRCTGYRKILDAVRLASGQVAS